MLAAFNEISDSQAKPTLHKKLVTDILLDYVHTHPNAKISYHASSMILYVELDATYYFVPGNLSLIAGH